MREIGPAGTLTAEETDLLQEIMNIGFGAASADLAAVLDLHVVLSVPSISIVAATELLAYLQKEIRDYSKASVIEQNFWSGFKGVALVVFSAGSGKGLVAVFGREEGASLFESDPIGALDKEVLMEVGNILVGACVGKVAELLGDIVTYSPPRVIIGNLAGTNLSRNVFDPEHFVIVLETVFHFSGKDVNGRLFLIANDESISWLKRALQDFLKKNQ
jgi:chemotaxis protein CheC